jgi:hypothetical protein
METKKRRKQVSKIKSKQVNVRFTPSEFKAIKKKYKNRLSAHIRKVTLGL